MADSCTKNCAVMAGTKMLQQMTEVKIMHRHFVGELWVCRRKEKKRREVIMKIIEWMIDEWLNSCCCWVSEEIRPK